MQTKEIVKNVLAILPKTKKILNAGNVEIKEKTGLGNVVTNIDVQLENYLRTALLEIFPEAQVIAEESADSQVVLQDGGLKFVLDPLDGTTNFTNGWPHTISIGIVNENTLVGGVIYDVMENKVYSGMKDYGVIQCDIDDITNIQMVKKPTYDKDNIKKALISYDTPYGAEAYKITQKMCSELYHSGASLKTVGPISLDVLKTALGKENRPCDYNCATWHSEVRAWDLAAATCILRELGGEIIGKDGKPLSTETLTNPLSKIAFIASGNEKLLHQLYEKYQRANKDEIELTK